MIDVKQAVSIALSYLNEVMGKQEGVQVEEVELNHLGEWLITLSFFEKVDYEVANPFSALSKKNRIYKTFTIDSKSAGVKSMKIRKLD